jgi:hypothetical protein
MTRPIAVGHRVFVTSAFEYATAVAVGAPGSADQYIQVRFDDGEVIRVATSDVIEASGDAAGLADYVPPLYI